MIQTNVISLTNIQSFCQNRYFALLSCVSLSAEREKRGLDPPQYVCEVYFFVCVGYVL